MSTWRHLRNRLIVIIQTITGLGYLLLCLKLLLLYSGYASNDLVLLSC